MILTSENTITENGTRVHSCVTLDIDAVGITERPFNMQAGVPEDLASSSHRTREDAEKARVKMHAMYTRTNA